MNSIIKATSSGESPFDSIRQVDESGQEYWLARELQKILGYSKWERFADAIDRAKASCKNVGNPVPENFFPEPGSYRGQNKEDYRLSRYACYLTAMNGDSRKPEIAAAQSYFAVKAREAEVITADSFKVLTSGQLAAIRDALTNPGSVSTEQFGILTDGISPAVVAKIGALTNEQYLKLYLERRFARVPQDIQDQIEAGEFKDKELKVAQKTIERFEPIVASANREWQQAIGGTVQKALKG